MKYKIVPFCPYHFVRTISSNTILSVYHFVHTILSVPFCPIPFCPYTILSVYHFVRIPFCPYTILSIPFCPYHFVRYHFVRSSHILATVNSNFTYSLLYYISGHFQVCVSCSFFSHWRLNHLNGQRRWLAAYRT